MNRANRTTIAVGAVGALLTYVVAPPGERILELGFLRFDPSLAIIAAFAFLVVYGVAMSVRQATAGGSEFDVAGFGTTEGLITLVLALIASAVAYTTTPTVANVLFNSFLTVIGMFGTFLLFRHFSWWYPGSGNKA